MTVSELIEELKKFDQEMEVGVIDDGMLEPVTSVSPDDHLWSKNKDILLIW